MDITTINHAMQLHANLLKTGPFHTQTPSLIKLLTFTALSHHGNIHYAHAILTSIPNSTSHLWNTIIRGYSISSEPKEALLLFCKMLNQGSPSPDNYTYPFLLKSCARLHAPEEGRQIHAVTFKTDLQSDPFVQNSLIYMYSNCKEPDASHKVFDKMDHRDVVSYTSMIAGYVDNRRSVKALDLYGKMEREGISPNEATLLALLGACASTGALSIGQKIHRIICRKNRGCEAKIFTALIDMYAKCGCIRCSKKLFNEMPRRDVFSWTAMIEGLASHGLCEEALLCFHSMKEEGSEPDQLTFTAILSACRNAG
ncbi:hypothetical protein AMTR_s00014p00257090 [Amborella trichopoda]|uniref:Pentacotripeptide-repeat region of PRORP domain-containing protein n=2 Tax=Amborella trichopoda TaxID=13333 RepID=W1PGV7_AMBTC|nr:hypothetical protein AMTR_s00014p00257090 [Amborella trichopoda]